MAAPRSGFIPFIPSASTAPNSPAHSSDLGPKLFSLRENLNFKFAKLQLAA
jgi:hypothetical protein